MGKALIIGRQKELAKYLLSQLAKGLRQPVMQGWSKLVAVIIIIMIITMGVLSCESCNGPLTIPNGPTEPYPQDTDFISYYDGTIQVENQQCLATCPIEVYQGQTIDVGNTSRADVKLKQDASCILNPNYNSTDINERLETEIIMRTSTVFNDGATVNFLFTLNKGCSTIMWNQFGDPEKTVSVAVGNEGKDIPLTYITSSDPAIRIIVEKEDIAKVAVYSGYVIVSFPNTDKGEPISERVDEEVEAVIDLNRQILTYREAVFTPAEEEAFHKMASEFGIELTKETELEPQVRELSMWSPYLNNESYNYIKIFRNKVNSLSDDTGLSINEPTYDPASGGLELLEAGKIDLVFTHAYDHPDLKEVASAMILSQLQPWEERDIGIYDILNELSVKRANAYCLFRAAQEGYSQICINDYRDALDLNKLKVGQYDILSALLIEALGGVPINSPLQDTYGDLSRGLIDGCIVTTESILKQDLYELLDYTWGPRFCRSDIAMYINFDTWNGLEEDQRQILSDVAAELEHNSAEVWETDLTKEREIQMEAGVSNIEFTDQQTESFYAIVYESGWQYIFENDPSFPANLKHLMAK